MRCDQCKHWAKAKEDEGPLMDWEAVHAGFGLCQAMRHRVDIQDEASENMEWDGAHPAYDPPKGAYCIARNAAIKKARAYVQDASDFKAQLITGPDFFCALFEA